MLEGIEVGSEGEFRSVIFATEVAEGQETEAVADMLREHLCRLVIAEVPYSTGDPFFEVKGVATILEHLTIVIALKDEEVGSSYLGLPPLG